MPIAQRLLPSGAYLATKISAVVPVATRFRGVDPPGLKSTVALKKPVRYTFPDPSAATPYPASSPFGPVTPVAPKFLAQRQLPLPSYLTRKISMPTLAVRLTGDDPPG